MFLFNFKLRRRSTAVFAAAFAAILTAVICAFCAASAPAVETASPAITDGNAAEEAAVGEYLDSLGITDRELKTCEGVKIPAHFNEVYEDYNALQERQGFDLSPFKGKTVRRYVYAVDGGSAVILAKDGRVIGGHFTEGEYGGDEQPLREDGTTG